MSNKSIVKVIEKNEAISVKLESVTFNSIRKIFPDHAILDACGQEKYDYCLCNSYGYTTSTSTTADLSCDAQRNCQPHCTGKAGPNGAWQTCP